MAQTPILATVCAAVAARAWVLVGMQQWHLTQLRFAGWNASMASSTVCRARWVTSSVCLQVSMASCQRRAACCLKVFAILLAAPVLLFTAPHVLVYCGGVPPSEEDASEPAKDRTQPLPPSMDCRVYPLAACAA